MVGGYHLAQINIARMRAAPADPLMAGFFAALDAVNALAEASPGFVWRLQDAGGNATSIRAFDDPTILINMSVWEDIDGLFEFVYKTGHTPFMRRRREWFETFDGPYIALWWIPVGTIPTLDDAKRRLDLIARNGPTKDAFTFKQRFPAPMMSEQAAE